MAQELQGFAKIQSNEHYFADYCQRVRNYGGWLDGYLAEGSSEVEGKVLDWSGDDHEALNHWGELEYALENLPVMAGHGFEDDANQISNDELERFWSLSHDFHAALPFSEAERVWFLRVFHQESSSTSAEFLRAMDHHEERIVTDGIRRLVNGRDLAQRWTAWHAQIGEYAEQDTVDAARAALDGLGRLCAAPEPSR
jgi:hypothetical protein